MNLIDVIVALLTIIAVFVPFIMSRLEKRDKLKKTIYLIELIKTKDELISLIKRHEENKGSPILLNKLNNNLNEIDQEIFTSKKRFILSGFLTFISLEILVLFYIMSNIILGSAKESGLFFFEGILGSELSRIILLFSLFSLSFFITFKLAPLIKRKIKNSTIFNLTVVIIYNLVFFIIGTISYLFLKYSDMYSPLY